jgi:tetratricopeptide (TPR) repeat protein
LQKQLYATIEASLLLQDQQYEIAQEQLLESARFGLAHYDEIANVALEKLSNLSLWRSEDLIWVNHYAVVLLAKGILRSGKLQTYLALLFLAKISLAELEIQTAGSLFQAALDGFIYLDVHRWRADCLKGLGDIAKTQGDITAATALWREAIPFYERSLQGNSIEELNQCLAEHQQDLTADVSASLLGWSLLFPELQPQYRSIMMDL